MAKSKSKDTSESKGGTSYHLMKRGGTTEGKTGDDAKRYRYARFDIVEAPKTEFEHLGDDVETFNSKEKAEKARAKALGK